MEIIVNYYIASRKYSCDININFISSLLLLSFTKCFSFLVHKLTLGKASLRLNEVVKKWISKLGYIGGFYVIFNKNLYKNSFFMTMFKDFAFISHFNIYIKNNKKSEKKFIFIVTNILAVSLFAFTVKIRFSEN